MRVVADTSVWSLLLRRRPNAKLDAYERRIVAELQELGEEDRLCMLGVIRQELLAGIQSAGYFKKLRVKLRAYDDYPVDTAVHELAAENHNTCLSRGVIPTAFDMLICTVARIESMAIFSTDPDMDRICKILNVQLHEPREALEP